jgi:hypothetical protein
MCTTVAHVNAFFHKFRALYEHRRFIEAKPLKHGLGVTCNVERLRDFSPQYQKAGRIRPKTKSGSRIVAIELESAKRQASRQSLPSLTPTKQSLEKYWASCCVCSQAKALQR